MFSEDFLELKEDKDFKDFTKEGLKVIIFEAAWCHPCSNQKKILEEVNNNFNTKVSFGYVNVDSSMDLAVQCKANSLPLTLIYNKGILEDSLVGVVAQTVLEDKLRTFL